MKKNTIILLVFLTTIVFCLFGCSEKSERNKSLAIGYSSGENYSNIEICSSKVADLIDKDVRSVYDIFLDDFSESTYKGCVAEIVPEEYIYYYVVRDDNKIDGYAECRCKITNISKKYNNTEYEVGDIINVRQQIYLELINEDAVLKMLKNVGAYKGNKLIPGVYKINNNLINENDFRLLILDSDFVLAENQPCYAIISVDDNIPYLGTVCYKNDDYNQNIPSDLSSAVSYLKEFLLENDKDMLE